MSACTVITDSTVMSPPPRVRMEVCPVISASRASGPTRPRPRATHSPSATRKVCWDEVSKRVAMTFSKLRPEDPSKEWFLDNLVALRIPDSRPHAHPRLGEALEIAECGSAESVSHAAEEENIKRVAE